MQEHEKHYVLVENGMERNIIELMDYLMDNHFTIEKLDFVKYCTQVLWDDYSGRIHRISSEIDISNLIDTIEVYEQDKN